MYRANIQVRSKAFCNNLGSTHRLVEQECIPLGRVPPARYRMGGLPNRDPPGHRPPDRDPPG